MKEVILSKGLLSTSSTKRKRKPTEKAAAYKVSLKKAKPLTPFTKVCNLLSTQQGLVWTGSKIPLSPISSSVAYSPSLANRFSFSSNDLVVFSPRVDLAAADASSESSFECLSEDSKSRLSSCSDSESGEFELGIFSPQAKSEKCAGATVSSSLILDFSQI